jgi:putative nucleotidyltransferase with HDIG domain
MAPVILFHHTGLKYMDTVPAYYRELAQILHIADRMEIASRFGGMSSGVLAGYLTGSNRKVFSQELLQLFFEFENEEFIDHDELWHQLGGAIQKRIDIDEYLKMLVLSIDFRSRHTVNHTVATAELSRLIANLFNLSSKEVEYTTNGALLHDLGKAGIPTGILENPGALSKEEMTVMKTHILLTGQILKGRVNRTVERIACRHHERLDGSGYPYGLGAAQLSLPERIVAVADILSALSGARSYKDVFPKDKVLSILTKMSGNHQIDPVIVQKIAENYEFLMSETAVATRPVTRNYDELSTKYSRLLENIYDMQKTKQFQFEGFC